jgi:hypothetical protein
MIKCSTPLSMFSTITFFTIREFAAKIPRIWGNDVWKCK